MAACATGDEEVAASTYGGLLEEHCARSPMTQDTPTVSASLLVVVLLLQINYGTRTLERVYQLHSAAINCMLVSEGLCVTGSDDKFLRVWPLDFSDFLLEVAPCPYVSLPMCVCVSVSPAC